MIVNQLEMKMAKQSARGKGKCARQIHLSPLAIHWIKKDKFLQKMYMNGDPCSILLRYSNFNLCNAPKSFFKINV